MPNWMIGKPAAFDLTVVSPLNSTTLNEAGARSGSAAGKAEVHKHNANDPKCTELGWVCLPLAVEKPRLFGCRSSGFHFLAGRPSGFVVAVQQVKAIASICQRLSLILIHCNARALISCARFPHSVDEG